MHNYFSVGFVVCITVWPRSAAGLPYPILTVAEHLSANSEGFAWGRKLRSAGYYTSIVIW